VIIMGRKAKNCYTKLREAKKRFKKEIEREQVLLYNWRKHKEELKPKNQLMKQYEINALQNNINKLLLIHKILETPYKHPIESFQYNKCQTNVKFAIKRIKHIINDINYELKEWRVNKHNIPRNETFFMKSIELQRKMELREYITEELIILERETLKETSDV